MAPSKVTSDNSFEICPQTLPSVADFFRGKNVFLTGASGFIGRTLIEKLLREAPDIGTIFVLLRPKKGKHPQERLAAMTNVKLFQRLRKLQPSALSSKVQAVAGDAQDPSLGLSAHDVAVLQDQVHVAFHVAASVRFDDPLKKAVLLNVRGTREMCELASGMKKLQVLVHVSTAYTNVEFPANKEQLYPPPGDWRVFVELAESHDQFRIDAVTKKMLGRYPNTYTYSKTLAEHVINDYKERLPLAIVRPSIVLGSRDDPFPGWMDNMNGPMGLALAAQCGAFHSFIDVEGAQLDTIPVDTVVRGLILMAVRRALQREPNVLPIVNATSHDTCIFHPRYASHLLRVMNFDFPVDIMSKPFLIKVSNEFAFYVLFYAIDLPISFFYEMVLRITRRKERVLKIHRLIYISYRKLFFFALQKFHLPNTKFLQLTEGLRPEDSTKFKLEVDDLHMVPYQMSLANQIKCLFLKPLRKVPKIKYISVEVAHYVLSAIALLAAWELNLPAYILRFAFTITGMCFFATA